MPRRGFWGGFAAGAAAGAGASFASLLLLNVIGRSRRSNVVRLEKSLQIGKPVEEVFNSWVELERLPQMSDIIWDIRREGNRSHWTVNVGGKRFEWDAEIEQFIPNQAIGWKSLSGPKHTGRVSFSPIGNDTLLQVTMNYAPPFRLFRPLIQSMDDQLEGLIEQALRDFKAALEGKGQESRIGMPVRSASEPGPGTSLSESAVERATGTFGVGQTSGATIPGENPRFGGQTNPVEYSSPPEARR